MAPSLICGDVGQLDNLRLFGLFLLFEKGRTEQVIEGFSEIGLQDAFFVDVELSEDCLVELLAQRRRRKPIRLVTPDGELQARVESVRDLPVADLDRGEPGLGAADLSRQAFLFSPKQLQRD